MHIQTVIVLSERILRDYDMLGANVHVIDLLLNAYLEREQLIENTYYSTFLYCALSGFMIIMIDFFNEAVVRGRKKLRLIY